MCGSIQGSAHNHVIELPQLSQKEMQILHQKTAKPIDILLQVLVLSLRDEEGGLNKALDFLRSCQDNNIELTQETIEELVNRLRKGNVRAWSKLQKIADKRPDSPVCEIVLRISPLNKRGLRHV